MEKWNECELFLLLEIVGISLKEVHDSLEEFQALSEDMEDFSKIDLIGKCESMFRGEYS